MHIVSLIIAVTVFYLALMTVCYSKHYNHILLLQDQVYSNARNVFNSVGIYVPTQVHTEKYYGPICTINFTTIYYCICLHGSLINAHSITGRTNQFPERQCSGYL